MKLFIFLFFRKFKMKNGHQSTFTQIFIFVFKSVRRRKRKRERGMSSITLYHTQPTRSVKIMVLLEEMGVAYAVKAVDLKKREQKTPEYLALNPFGKVPTLTDGPLVLFESSAIAYYLLEKYDANRKLSPPPGTRENAVHHLVCISF